MHYVFFLSFFCHSEIKHLGGVAAILRYDIPDDEMLMEDDSELVDDITLRAHRGRFQTQSTTTSSSSSPDNPAEEDDEWIVGEDGDIHPAAEEGPSAGKGRRSTRKEKQAQLQFKPTSDPQRPPAGVKESEWKQLTQQVMELRKAMEGLQTEVPAPTMKEVCTSLLADDIWNLRDALANPVARLSQETHSQPFYTTTTTLSTATPAPSSLDGDEHFPSEGNPSDVDANELLDDLGF